jgi:hypothetical protein
MALAKLPMIARGHDCQGYSPIKMAPGHRLMPLLGGMVWLYRFRFKAMPAASGA